VELHEREFLDVSNGCNTGFCICMKISQATIASSATFAPPMCYDEAKLSHQSHVRGQWGSAFRRIIGQTFFSGTKLGCLRATSFDWHCAILRCLKDVLHWLKMI
jgi:hypothetical protein